MTLFTTLTLLILISPIISPPDWPEPSAFPGIRQFSHRNTQLFENIFVFIPCQWQCQSSKAKSPKHYHAVEVTLQPFRQVNNNNLYYSKIIHCKHLFIILYRIIYWALAAKITKANGKGLESLAVSLFQQVNLSKTENKDKRQQKINNKAWIKLHQQEINELANELLCKKINNFQERFLLRPIVDFPIIRSRFYPLLYLHACRQQTFPLWGECAYFWNDQWYMYIF
jgi:hypothetical protein